MRNVTNILICNLSVSDIILAGIILPQNLHDISHEDDFHEGPFLCKVAFAFPILCITSASYTLATMAFERRNCIVDSLKTQITNRHCKFIIPSVWVIAFLAATPTIIEFQVVDQQTIEDNKTEIHQACNSDMVPRAFVIGNGIMLLFVTYIVPLVIILYNYSRIIYFVVQQTGSSTDQSTTAAVANSTILKKKMKIIKMLIIVAVLFAVSWLPYFITLIIAKSRGSDGSESASSVTFLVKIALAAFSTAYNVVLYVTFNPMFRQAFLRIFMCNRKKQNKVAAVSDLDTQNRPIERSRGVLATADTSVEPTFCKP
ncbi:neuropeptide Y receptor type 2-like [Mytilus edulis]|uniref:neuropeptide Y receptor type 2-like n=1 Tax=Mytilus edulis TaxID=6550 RepID=UPI0039EE19CA